MIFDPRDQNKHENWYTKMSLEVCSLGYRQSKFVLNQTEVWHR